MTNCCMNIAGDPITRCPDPAAPGDTMCRSHRADWRATRSNERDRDRATYRVPGAVALHKIISTAGRPADLNHQATNEIIESARHELEQLGEIWAGKPARVHVIVTVQPSRDPAGNIVGLSDRLVRRP